MSNPTDSPDEFPPMNERVLTVLRALGELGSAAEQLGADEVGRSENRLYAEMGRSAAAMAEQLVADRSASVALGMKFYQHVSRLIHEKAEPSEQDYFELGSTARYVAERANARVAGLARGDDMTPEQFARDLLSQAISDGLVSPASDEWNDPDPQARSAGELVALANSLMGYSCNGGGNNRPATNFIHKEWKRP
ncbi:hypothetical protein [Nocardia sp. NPDC057030]|uniref:hypothetical protein n=1 Tax=unclassified Nocardia TaxID=2637762 RepID=UPI003631DDF7